MKRALIIASAITIAAFTILAAFALTNSWGQTAEIKQYTRSLLIEEKTYLITILTNETSEPKVYLPENENTLKYFCVDFIGPPGNKQFFFNITYPKNLVWGDFSLVAKYYVQDPSRYTLSSNETHQSVYMSYVHYNVNCHFEIRGTEAAW